MRVFEWQTRMRKETERMGSVGLRVIRAPWAGPCLDLDCARAYLLGPERW
jgi:hypothetical protein